MCKTIKQKVKFKATPQEVYNLLADSKQHTAFSRQKANISPKVGGRFTTGAGRIEGINVDLVPGKRIVQAWRAKNFPGGIFSMATFNLEPTKTGTELTLIHRGVPKELIPATEENWRENYWERMKAYLKK